MALPLNTVFLPADHGRGYASYRYELRPDWNENKDYPYCACGRRFVPVDTYGYDCIFCLRAAGSL